MVDLQVSVNLDWIDEWTKELEKELAKAVKKTAFFIERQAKLYAPFETGFLRNSIYVLTWGANSVRLVARNGKMVPQVAMPADRFEAVVAAGAEYAVYVEYGHFAKRGTTRMSYRSDTKKGPRYTAQRIQDRAYGTFVQGRFFFSKAGLDAQAYFYTACQDAVRAAGAKAKL